VVDSSVLAAFNLGSPTEPIRKFGSGLIHETYLFTGVSDSFLIQKINHSVFKDVEGMMANIGRVLGHLTAKHNAQKGIEFLPATGTKNYYFSDGEYWRVTPFIKESYSYDTIQDIKQAREAGRIVASFHKNLADFRQYQLVHTIPSFHDLNARVNQFEYAIQEDTADRLKTFEKEIDQLIHQVNWLSSVGFSDLPLRVTHNDTKLNNILFDKDNQAICLIDLDTVMPGQIVFDTGDILRTMCNSGGEDGTLGAIQFYEAYFLEFSKGYILESRPILTREELEAIPYSILRMNIEQTVRFATDYLMGDIYYHQPYAGFNRNAVRAGITFSALIQSKYNELEKLIRKQLTL
jgi:hypothetical protein